ncbi:hypothetical protein ACHHYP_05540 [Achlya hypogyna]|uniref:PX domain-containing protein n=1 Tax=Achlya hypogyna TaxID=1202772 RepID=A0A1V9ZNP2_ACHHY|nr:hypothetical protein ACHHYP_05540 [Achlya hypogyna]
MAEKVEARRRPSPIHVVSSVLSASVVGHAIVRKESEPSSRSRRRLTLDKIRRPYLVVFEVTIVTAAPTPERIHRSYPQFQSLHNQLRKKYPRSPQLPLPVIKPGRYDSAYIELKYAVRVSRSVPRPTPELGVYLQHLLETIPTCDVLGRFFRDVGVGSDSDDDSPPTAATTVTIRKGQSYSVSLEIPGAHAAVAYQFATRKHDVGFSITLNDDTLQGYSREAALKGVVRCPAPGLCTLTWDNSYVWHRSKVVTYHAEVVLMSPRAESPRRSLRTQSLSRAAEDATPTGYIEHVHRAPILLSPRRLVHTSMRKIIGWSKPEAWLKAGPMIIQRRRAKLKHALLHAPESWYRKWFTLDGAHGILRCYDNQSSVTREGPQGRLKLTSGQATLSVVDARHLHGPTPTLCTESEEDFVSWRQAISTSIFLVNWPPNHGAKSDEDDDGSNGDDENDDIDDIEENNDLAAVVAVPVRRPTYPCAPLAASSLASATALSRRDPRETRWPPVPVVLALNALVLFLAWSHWVLFWSVVVAFNGIVVYHATYEADDDANSGMQ